MATRTVRDLVAFENYPGLVTYPERAYVLAISEHSKHET